MGCSALDKSYSVQLGQPELAQNGTGENVPKKWVWGPETAAPEGGIAGKSGPESQEDLGTLIFARFPSQSPPMGPQGN